MGNISSLYFISVRTLRQFVYIPFRRNIVSNTRRSHIDELFITVVLFFLYLSVLLVSWDGGTILEYHYSFLQSDSFLSEQCTFYFDHFADSTRGQTLSTDCPLVVAPVNEVNLSECKRMTCTGGGNILNYHQGTCEMRRCQGNDYMLSSARGGWDIYTLDVTRLPTESPTMLPGNADFVQDGVGWIPIAVPIVCVCVFVPIVVVTVVVIRRRKETNVDETVTYDDTIQMPPTMQAAEKQTETQNAYPGLKSRDQPEPSEYETMQTPIYEQVE